MSEAEFKPTGLSDILSGEAAPEPAQVAETPPPAAVEAPPAADATPEAQPEGERPRKPKGEPGAGQFVPKDKADEAGAAAPAAEAEAATDAGGSPPPEKAPVPQAALMNERRRRQEAENFARELQARVDALTRLPQTPSAEEPPKVDFWDNPDAVLEARFSQFGQSLIEQFEQRQVVRHVNQSEAAARAKYEDFDEALVEFQRASMSNPALVREMAAQPDPGEFAYRKGKSLSEVHAYGGDIDALLAAKRAEWEAELRASAPPPTPSLPPSTATERSVSVARTGPAWAGPASLSDLLGS